MWLLIVGDPVEGYVFIGPFQDHDGPDGAFAAGEALYGRGDCPMWSTAPIQTEAEARADVAWAAGVRARG
jgi:hypothetical protein